jgi:hypothetical protein
VVSRRRTTPEEPESRRPAAKTPEGRENQLIALAVDQAEKQLRAGTASAQVITHFLKLGTTREQLEQERLSLENRLTEAKIATIGSQAQIEELMKAALEAMSLYKGEVPIPRGDDYED